MLESAIGAIYSDRRDWDGVNEIVTSLKVTKGNFYWNVENRDLFVLELLNFWNDKCLLAVAKEIQHQNLVTCHRILGGNPTIKKDRMSTDLPSQH